MFNWAVARALIGGGGGGVSSSHGSDVCIGNSMVSSAIWKKNMHE